jgi:hypothetical protein
MFARTGLPPRLAQSTEQERAERRAAARTIRSQSEYHLSEREAPPLSDELVEQIARVLGAVAELAPFRVHGASVHRLRLAPAGKPELTLTLWPSLARADVLAGDCYAVFKGIDRVLLFPGQEVIFQRAQPRGFLLVSCAGRVATAS